MACRPRVAIRSRRADGGGATGRNHGSKSLFTASRGDVVWCASTVDKRRLLDNYPAIQRDCSVCNHGPHDSCGSDDRLGLRYRESNILSWCAPYRLDGAQPGRIRAFGRRGGQPGGGFGVAPSSHAASGCGCHRSNR